MTSGRVDLPSDEPIVRAAAQVIGGPVGRYASLVTQSWPPQQLRRGAASYRRSLEVLAWQPVAAVLSLLGSLTLTTGLAQKSYCLINGWGVPEVFWRACYIDMPYLFLNTQLFTGGAPYPSAAQTTASNVPLSHPVLTGAALWVTSLIVPGEGDALKRQQAYVAVWATAIAILLVVLVIVTAATARRQPWRAAHVALSPLLVSVALVSPDMLGVTLAAVGMYAWSRSRPLLAGLAFGAAVAARTYPLLIVGVIGLLALRSGRLREWAGTAGVTLLTWTGAVVAGGITNGFSDLRPYAAWWGATADYGSVWFLAKLVEKEIPAGVLTIAVMVSWVVAASVGTLMALVPAHRPRVAEVSIVVLVIAIALGKSVPVQTSLWLVPLVALAGFSWRTHLIWATTEILYFCAVWFYLGGLSDAPKSLPLGWYSFFTVLRFAGLGLLLVTAWRNAWQRPPADPQAPVDEAEIDDPDDAAGVMLGRPDSVIVTLT